MTQLPKKRLFLSMEIENKLRNAIWNGDFNSFSQLSRDLKWGKPSWSCTQLLLEILDFHMNKLRKWAKRKDEQTRWNVAVAFASYGGNKNWQAGMEILSNLATDERRYVWRAVASALRYLSKRHPEVGLLLRQWLDDPKRRQVAAEVLSRLTKPRSTGKKGVGREPLSGSHIRLTRYACIFKFWRDYREWLYMTSQGLPSRL